MNSEVNHSLQINKIDCTGCGACAATCQFDAIKMQPDGEGFLYPSIDAEICTGCNSCKQICPVNKYYLIKGVDNWEEHQDKSPAVFAGWNRDEDIRQKSSSGGVFTVLAENILGKRGVVVGAAYDDRLTVRHTIIESSADLHNLRGSKYVQSEISPHLYRNIRSLLNESRIVLFSGTPCQVAGIKNFLQKPYDTFFCCSILCHGVPSPLLLDRYIKYIMDSGKGVVNISFRDKVTGWKNYSVSFRFINGYHKSWRISVDPFMTAFLRNYSLRSSCYICKFKTILQQGDLTIADFWGVAKKYPQYDLEDKGTSLIIVNNDKGRKWLEACCPYMIIGPADINAAIAGNPSLIRSVSRPKERDNFYYDLLTLSFSKLVRKYHLYQPSYIHRLLTRIIHEVRNFWKKL